MSEATEKQISFATSLGIQDAASKSKETLKVLIDEALKAKGVNTDKPQKVQPQPSNAVIGATEGISEVKHLFQNAYEFGKAGDRITIRFWDVEDFKKQIKEIQAAKEELGLLDIETIKV